MKKEATVKIGSSTRGYIALVTIMVLGLLFFFSSKFWGEEDREIVKSNFQVPLTVGQWKATVSEARYQPELRIIQVRIDIEPARNGLPEHELTLEAYDHRGRKLEALDTPIADGYGTSLLVQAPDGSLDYLALKLSNHYTVQDAKGAIELKSASMQVKIDRRLLVEADRLQDYPSPESIILNLRTEKAHKSASILELQAGKETLIADLEKRREALNLALMSEREAYSIIEQKGRQTALELEHLKLLLESATETEKGRLKAEIAALETQLTQEIEASNAKSDSLDPMRREIDALDQSLAQVKRSSEYDSEMKLITEEIAALDHRILRLANFLEDRGQTVPTEIAPTTRAGETAVTTTVVSDITLEPTGTASPETAVVETSATNSAGETLQTIDPPPVPTSEASDATTTPTRESTGT